MHSNKNKNQLIEYVLKLNRILKENGFKIKWHTSGEIKLLDYRTDPDDMIYPEVDFTTITADEEAFRYLEKKGLINSGICPMCGEQPIENRYVFTSPSNPSISYKICFSCFNNRPRF